MSVTINDTLAELNFDEDRKTRWARYDAILGSIGLERTCASTDINEVKMRAWIRQEQTKDNWA